MPNVPLGGTLASQGFQLEDGDGKVNTVHLPVVPSITDALADGQTFDLALVAVKAYHTESVAQELQEWRSSDAGVDSTKWSWQ